MSVLKPRISHHNDHDAEACVKAVRFLHIKSCMTYRTRHHFGHFQTSHFRCIYQLNMAQSLLVNNLKSFSVVFFNQENKYSVVPSTWISEDYMHCYWPNKKVKNANSLIEDSTSIPSSSWSLHSIEVIKSYGMYKFFPIH